MTLPRNSAKPGLLSLALEKVSAVNKQATGTIDLCENLKPQDCDEKVADVQGTVACRRDLISSQSSSTQDLPRLLYFWYKSAIGHDRGRD